MLIETLQDTPVRPEPQAFPGLALDRAGLCIVCIGAGFRSPR